MASNSTSLSYPAGYNPATLSVEASASGSYISASASLNSGGSYWSGWTSCVLQLLIDGNVVAEEAPNFYSHNSTATISGGKTVGDGSHTIMARWVKSGSANYVPNSGSTSCSVSVSTVSSGTFTIGSSERELGEYLALTLVAGKGNSFTGLTWSCNGQSGSLSPATQNWFLDPYDFADALKNVTQATVTLVATQSQKGSITRTFKIKVPDSYIPVIEFESRDIINPVNNNMIAGISSFRINFETDLYPAENSATIASVAVQSYVVTPSTVGAINFTVDLTNKRITSGVLPNFTGGSSYTISMVLKVTDSRGRSSTVTITQSIIGTVYCYIPPSFTILTLERCDGTGATKPSGKYCRCVIQVVNPDGSAITTCAITINNLTYNLTRTSGNASNGEWSATVGNGALLIGNQYPVIISVRNQTMVNYGDPAITIANILPTMAMPISLYDDGSKVGASIGEMATNYSDITADQFLNFAQGLQLRATDEYGNTIVKTAYEVLLAEACPYPIGGVFISVNSARPETIWADTSWTLMDQGDVYRWQRDS